MKIYSVYTTLLASNNWSIKFNLLLVLISYRKNSITHISNLIYQLRTGSDYEPTVCVCRTSSNNGPVTGLALHNEPAVRVCSTSSNSGPSPGLVRVVVWILIV